MEADWEVEIGGDAPVIDVDWPGFVDLRAFPEKVGELVEAACFPALASLLQSLNSSGSPVWTSKCDVWRTETDTPACYVDLLPRDENIFNSWNRVETLCRDWISRLISPEQAHGVQSGVHPVVLVSGDSESEAAITLVIRRAITRRARGFGITAYMSAGAQNPSQQALEAAMFAFSNAVLGQVSPQGVDRR